MYPSFLDNFSPIESKSQTKSETKLETESNPKQNIELVRLPSFPSIPENTSYKADRKIVTKFEPIQLENNRGPLVIHNKRWYFRLVKKDKQRSRCLMDDYSINDIWKHLVICFTPGQVNGKPLVNKDGKLTRIYAFFDTYIEYFEYIQKFKPDQWSFYEIFFGELPQKPHFDIDISAEEANSSYPTENINNIATQVMDALISSCCEILSLNLNKDILIYSSHGAHKKSYHLIITNHCHDGNEEAKAFYEKVVKTVSIITNNKYVEFIDPKVYSPRQQFRIIGSQKLESNRPKAFNETFIFKGREYVHEYPEPIHNINLKKLIVLYESLVGFTSGCTFLPSFVPPNVTPLYVGGVVGDLLDVDVNTAFKLTADKFINTPFMIGGIEHKIKIFPFAIREIEGNRIFLKRIRSSLCPVCRKKLNHDTENSLIMVICGKIYWKCFRNDKEKIFIGYLEFFSFANGNSEVDGDEDNDEGYFTFGDFVIPELAEQVAANNKIRDRIEQKKVEKDNSNSITKSANNDNIDAKQIEIVFEPPKFRLLDGVNEVTSLVHQSAQKKYERGEVQDVSGQRSLKSAFSGVLWNTNY